MDEKKLTTLWYVCTFGNSRAASSSLFKPANLKREHGDTPSLPRPEIILLDAKARLIIRCICSHHLYRSLK